MDKTRIAFATLALLVATLWAFAPTDSVVDSADPGDVYNPVVAGEPLPDGFRQLLARDAIKPIYEPTFRSSGDTSWPDNALVIGVAAEGAAKAYPVSALNSREMVVDRIAGIPILVTW